jgi:hypothetical protein
LLLAAFLIWFVWAFLNDSEGRLWRWTDGNDGLAAIHKMAKVPATVQKALDEQAGKKTDTGQTNPSNGAASSTATNTVPAK